MRYSKDYTEQEIEIISSKYKNKVKKAIFKQYANQIKSKRINFDDMWSGAMSFARSLRMKDLKSNIQNERKSISETAGILIANAIETNNDYFSILHKQKGKTIAEKYQMAMMNIIDLRTEEFRKIHGHEKIKFGDRNLILNTWYKMFKNGEISDKEFSMILDVFKSTDYYKNKYSHEYYKMGDINEFFD